MNKLWFSTSGTSRWVPAVTQPAPAFKATAVQNGEFKDLSLADFKGKYLVLLFYPLDLWVLLVILRDVWKNEVNSMIVLLIFDLNLQWVM